jgi:2'-hydroxyisoflavone reductase
VCGLSLLEPILERLTKVFAGDPEEQARPARPDPDGAHALVTLAIAARIRLGLAQRAQPHKRHRTPFPRAQSKIHSLWTGSVTALKLLVLGGTKFLGRATVESALAHGHEVTLFNRGQTNPDLFPQTEKLHGDRVHDLAALDGRRTWDAIVDPSGYVPAVVRASAEKLAASAAFYLFVSSLSVYADRSRTMIEGDELEQLGDMPDDRLLEDFSNYGALKALSEQAVAETFPDRHANVRPGLIVGPHDPTGRFTYWPHRIARGGRVAAPAPPEDTVQFVDVRDLADWIVGLCERGDGGELNAVSPGISWSHLLETCRDVSGSDASFVWIDGKFLVDQGIEQWMGLPLWIEDEADKGLHRADISRATETGLTHRPLAETVEATLELAETTEAAGLSPDREAALLEAWAGR